MLAAMSKAARPIVFLSDFGLGNEWVGICHSVLSSISPASPVIDLSHLVRPLDVASGALLLADSMPYVAEDAVVLAVVDPTVGKDREIAVRTESGRDLVGPDNGLLSLAWQASGGITRAVEVTSPEVIRPPHAESFRAPDTLCRAAGALAGGLAVDELGDELDANGLATVTVPAPEIEPGKIRCQVLDFNRFGNVQLNVRVADLEGAGIADASSVLVDALSGSAEARRGSTYADFDAGEYGLLFDSRGWLMIVRGDPGSALEGLGLGLGHEVWISQVGGSDGP
jgi:S-adenosyl-L-methionine hydrolase (adenosine-forming)